MSHLCMGTVYVYLNGEPVAMRVAGDWFWFLNDHLGTPRKMVDAFGAVVWKAAYLPFGRAIVAQADVENNLRFPGQYFDEETGLHYNWHRYYDPGTGRYLRADPIGLAGGINLFAYAANNPVNNFDKNGLFWDTFLDIGFMIWDVVDVATADNPCERREAFTSLGMNALGAAIPFATGLGKGYKVAKRASKKLPKPTIRQRYTDAVQEATKRYDGNVTVQRDGVDLFRVHQSTSGHGTNVTQIVRRPRPSDGKVFPTPREVPVRRTHVEQLERALKGDPRYNLRTRGGR